MWPVTDRFLTAIRQPGIRTIATVDVLDQGTIVQGGLPIVSGTLTRDRTALNLGRLSCVVASPELAPRTPTDILGPAGFELQLNTGVQYYDGTQELVPSGIYGIQKARVSGADLTTSIDADDRSRKVAEALLEVPRSFAPGHDPGLTALALVLEVIPGVTLHIDSVGFEAGGRVTYGVDSNRWSIINSVFKSVGAWVYFDGEGNLAGQPEPDVRTTNPVWTIDDGPGGVLIATQPVDLLWSRESAFNKTRVVAENLEFDVTYVGTATDTATSSPSFYGGRFGPKPMPTVHSAHATSTAGCQAAARALLVAKQGVAMSIDFSTVPNRALEPADVVTIRQTNLGIDLPVVIDSLVTDLAPGGGMTGAVRARQEDDVEV